MSVRSSPERPLLKPWFRLARGEDRILLEYGHALVCFEGAAASLLLPALLPLLDGTRSQSQLVGCLGEAARPAIENALEVLASSGVLDNGPPLDTDLPTPFAGTVEHLAATAPCEISVSQVSTRLQEATVGVLGTGFRAEELARMLRLSGVAETRSISWEASRGDAGRLDLVVAVPEAAEVGQLERWNRLALSIGAEWLQILPFDGRLAAVGPVFVPGETCCFECYRLRRASNVAYREDFWLLERESAPFPSAASLEHALLGIGAHAALRWLVYRDPSLAGTFHAVELTETLGVSLHYVYRVPRCPACSVAEAFGKPLPWFESEPQ